MIDFDKIKLELLTTENIDCVKAIRREDISEEWVDNTDVIMEYTQYGLEHGCIGRTYAIMLDKTYIGIILLGEAIPWETDPEEMQGIPFYRLLGFVLDSRYRNFGIGGYVLESVIAKIYNEFGIRPIALGIHKDNTGAVRFYERHGFVKTQSMDGNDYYYIRYPVNINKISDNIEYIAASDNPLSADIGIIRSGDSVWLYDVGNNKNSIRPLGGQYNVVLSHFHSDHVGNLDKLNVRNLYVSKFTFEHVGKGIIVDRDMYIDNLHIFPLPSSHTKGALGLEIDGKYAFIGDAIYSKSNAEYYIYNAQLLRAEIDVLKKLKADNLLVSHFEGMVRNKSEVIQELENIYSSRDKSSPEIFVKKNS